MTMPEESDVATRDTCYSCGAPEGAPMEMCAWCYEWVHSDCVRVVAVTIGSDLESVAVSVCGACRRSTEL